MIHRVYADRLALEAWVGDQLQDAPDRVKRYMAAIGDMPIEGRIRFIAVALLYPCDLSKILLPTKADE